MTKTGKKAGGKTDKAADKSADQPEESAAAEPDWKGVDWKQTAARVRMYRHGLGDCFLLTFPRGRGQVFHVLIDCGVILGTPEGARVIGEVVADLKRETDHAGTPTVDVLVATHEHWDHLSGFADARDEFDEFDIKETWLAWTEKPGDKLAKQLRDDRAERLKKLKKGMKGLKAGLAAAGALGADAKGEPTGPAAEDYQRVAEVLAFFGVSPDDPVGADGGLGAAGGGKLGIADAMDWCRGRDGAKFWEPGDLIEPEPVKGLRVYVLGPPKDVAQLHKPLPTRSGHETYEAAFGAAAGGAAGAGGDAPFDPKYRVEMDEAAATPFYRTNYFGTGAGDDHAWRRIDGAPLDGPAAFALQLDNDTNNTSLALAFELPDGRVLLFPADAQVGNWESWHADSSGVKRVWKVDGKEVTAADLLAKTVLYKVGHHGSHNATLRGQGLELMTHDDLAALVPVDTYIAHEKKHWKQMPFDPLMGALRKKASGRVIVADLPVAKMPKNTFPAGRAVDSDRTITVTGTEGKPVTRPLYVDYFIPAK